MGLIPAALFVCSGNTCRSVFAMYIAREVCGSCVQFDSAGVAPQAPEDASMAIETLRRMFSIDASSHVPKDVKYVRLSRYNLIVAMDEWVAERIAETMPIPPGVNLETWDVADPWESNPDRYTACCQSVEVNVRDLCSRLDTSNRHTTG
jgi:protein-tyrosine-phosphatase